MEEMILCDTSVMVSFYRGDAEIINVLKTIGQSAITLNTVIAGELIFGARNKHELNTLQKDISSLRVLPINEEISVKSLELLGQFSLSHHHSLPDSLIAATSLFYKIPLYTLNLKDFRYIPDLVLFEPPVH